MWQNRTFDLFTPSQTPAGLPIAEWQHYWFFLLRFTFFLTGFESHGQQSLNCGYGKSQWEVTRGRDAWGLKCCKMLKILQNSHVLLALKDSQKDLLPSFLILPQTPNQSVWKDNIGCTSPNDSFRRIWFSEMNRTFLCHTRYWLHDPDHKFTSSAENPQDFSVDFGTPCPHFRPRKLNQDESMNAIYVKWMSRNFWVFWLGCSFHLTITKTLYFEAVRCFNMYFMSFLASEHEKRLANLK